MADGNDKVFLDRVTDAANVFVIGSSKQEIESSIRSIDEMSVLEAAKKYGLLSKLDPEKQRASYIEDLRSQILRHPEAMEFYALNRDKGISLFTSTIIARSIEQYEQTVLGKAKPDTAAAYAKKYADATEELMKVLFVVMQNGAKGQQDTLLKFLAGIQDKYTNQMDKVIGDGIEGIISPHRAAYEMATLGVKFGMLMSGVGMLLGKDEWVEAGQKLSKLGTETAEREGQYILDKKNELLSHYSDVPTMPTNVLKQLRDLKLNYAGDGAVIFGEGWKATDIANLQQIFNRMDPLLKNQLMEIPEIKRILLGEGMGTGATLSGFDNAQQGAAWVALLKQESGFDMFAYQNGAYKDHQIAALCSKKSGKNACGVGQMIEETARRAAERLGMQYDPKRYATDINYQLQLSQEEFRHLLQKYDGNVTLALAAYNAGEGAVNDFMNGTNLSKNSSGGSTNPKGIRLGDPRKDEISNADFARKFPYTETRDYIKSIDGIMRQQAPQYAMLAGAEVEAKKAIEKAKTGSDLSTEFNGEKQAAASGDKGPSELIPEGPAMPGSFAALSQENKNLAFIHLPKLTLDRVN